MPETTSPAASSNSKSPTQTPLSVQRPEQSARKRKFSTAEAASPTSLDEVSSTTSSSSSPPEGRVISPKKKAKAEERSSGSGLSKWESHVVASIASALDLDCVETAEPISFSAAPAGDLSADELEVLCRLLA